MGKGLRWKWIVAVWLLCSVAVSAQTADDRALMLMREGDGLVLNRLLTVRADSLSEGVRAMGEAFVRGCLGDAKQGAKLMKRALRRYQGLLNEALVARLTFGMALQQHRNGRDRKAAKTLSRYAEKHGSFAMRPTFERYGQLFRACRPYRKVRMNTREAVVPFRIDSVGPQNARSVAVRIPAIVNGVAVDMMLDTGATLNILSQGMAEQLGMDMIDAEVFLDGMGENRGRMAVAKLLRMGNLEMRNVLFCVMDNDHEVGSHAETAHLNAILGLPLLELLGCVQLDFRSKTLRSATDMPLDEANMSCGFAENGLQVEVRHHENRLSLIPDMGATHSAVGIRSFAIQPDYITRNYPNREVVFVGWGGSVSGKEYLYPQFDVVVGSTVVSLPQLSILEGTDYDSRLGMDFFTRCERVTFRLRYPAGLCVIPWR